ncbi:serine protease inhibitor swm-1-like [Zerene cesonia]|uniref:serine protease inhibitor swm-1-like n=1 Tax=Zerene cesonia TaxID=33412 RepID=UPI0018E57CB5|nr:serine protease inhibitor swm-1-like [Zerene cesonia]
MNLLRSILFSYTLAVIVYGVWGIYVVKDECPKNEEYLLCGSACPFNCTDPKGPVSCFDDCVEGCFCKAGYLRHGNGTCVNADECINEQCFNQNEVYDICTAACEPTCDDPEPICSKVCAAGCVCAPGLFRDGNGTCISVDKCPITNGTSAGPLGKYIDAIGRILHLSVV